MGWHPGQVALFPTKNDLIPAERAQLGDAQPVAIGDPDHDGIAVPVPVQPRGGDRALDFLGSQAFAGAALGLGELGWAGLSHLEGLASWPRAGVAAHRTRALKQRLTVPGRVGPKMGQFGWALPGSGYPLRDTSERRLVIVS